MQVYVKNKIHHEAHWGQTPSSGEAMGGMDYTAVAMAIKRFEKRAGIAPDLRQWMQVVKHECEKWTPSSLSSWTSD